MNLKAIIASVVLAASSTAMAAPAVTANARIDFSATTTTVRDHRQPAPAPIVYKQPSRHDDRGGWNHQPAPRPVYRTVTLASALNFANDGRTFITVGAQAGKFEKLQLSAAGGRTYIEQVYVQFDNGQEQVIRSLDRTLTGSEQLTLDLDGNRRAIKRIVVYGKNLNGGIRATTGFNVMAV